MAFLVGEDYAVPGRVRVGGDMAPVSAQKHVKHVASPVLVHVEHRRLVAYQRPQPVLHACDRPRRLVAVYVPGKEGALKQVLVERESDLVTMSTWWITVDLARLVR